MIKSLRQKKSHLMEIQVNGGTIADKVRRCVENGLLFHYLGRLGS